jgi:hypothetical protein
LLESVETGTNSILNDSVLNETENATFQTKSMETSPTDEPTKTDVKEVPTVDVGEAATRPTKVKDFTVLANLVQLFEHSIPKCDFKWYVVKTQTQCDITCVN